ncbi:FAD-dependent oxidoreductase [Oscillatoria sp. FACHB-1407]|uniref:flavin monoamine oxidase family protein n=1 Tax=Oscillatoria sp. FACHB-1407 TaxID=2692847 RepID=UPI001682474D|nr:NAD(P)/FAD-dependent oxidoreductase [Oscillatoria sp. FACHB-1407]MBD2462466.1 FAD-dependent oxidoreductase [Oscillatoria sp. FACHB-1407]
MAHTPLFRLLTRALQKAQGLNRQHDPDDPPRSRRRWTRRRFVKSDKLTVPFIRTLIELTIRTEYGVEPEESSALQLLFNLPSVEDEDATLLSSDEAFLVEGGNSKIIEGLADALSGQIQTQKRLTRLQSNGSGFRLTFGNGSTVSADYVILAIPFPLLRQVNLQVNLPATLRRCIQEVNLGSNEKLFAGFHNKIWRQENGFAGEAWSDLGFSATWDDTDRQGDRPEGVLTFYLGGDEVAATRTGLIDWQGKRFVSQIDPLIPGIAAASTNRFLRTRWTQDRLIGGGYTTFKPGQYTEFSEFRYIESDDPEESQNVAVGNLVFAGEQFSDEFYGFMNGAAQTGRLAAQVVLNAVLV